MVIGVEAERVEESLKMRVQSLAALEAMAGGMERGLIVELDPRLAGNDTKWRSALAELSKVLVPGGGDIRLRVRSETAGVVEVRLRGRFDTAPKVQGQLSTVTGVAAVREL